MKRVVDRARFEKVSRILATLINAIIFVSLLLIFVVIIPKQVVQADTTTYEEYVVEKNDTLWSIASENKKAGQDIREYIYELQKLNNLDYCMIYPGQEIKIIK